jgi:hypothetical protein
MLKNNLMKTNQIRAEVFNLKGEKVHISKNYNKMDLSELGDDVYLIYYLDNNGNMVGIERFVKTQEAEYVHVVDRF